MVRYPVIDKSYLEGASRRQVQDLCATGALMSDALYAELLTTDPESRRRCFSHFAATPNPIIIIPTIGSLLRYEMETRAPCTPLVERRLYARFEFQEGLTSGTYEFSDSDRAAVREIKQQIVERVGWFRSAAAFVEAWFPELTGFPANGPRGPIESAMNRVATDVDCIRAIYEEIVSSMRALLAEGSVPPMPEFNPPTPMTIDGEWAWFRHLQVLIVAALDFLRKNGARNLGEPSQALEHHLLDAEYVTAGVLAGALASRDRTVQMFFRLLCPNGLLIC